MINIIIFSETIIVGTNENIEVDPQNAVPGMRLVLKFF